MDRRTSKKMRRKKNTERSMIEFTLPRYLLCLKQKEAAKRLGMTPSSFNKSLYRKNGCDGGGSATWHYRKLNRLDEDIVHITNSSANQRCFLDQEEFFQLKKKLAMRESMLSEEAVVRIKKTDKIVRALDAMNHPYVITQV